MHTLIYIMTPGNAFSINNICLLGDYESYEYMNGKDEDFSQLVTFIDSHIRTIRNFPF